MTKRPSNFKERVKYCLTWEGIKPLLLINTVFALVSFLTSYHIGVDTDWFPKLLYDFLGAFFIGTSIFLTTILSGVWFIEKQWKKFLGMTGAFIIGGWGGNLIIYLIFPGLFAVTISTESIRSMLINNTFLTLIIGGIVTSYFMLREKLEVTVARLAEKNINEEQLLRLKLKAELEALRAKVDPHFLFNTHSSIASLIPVDPAKAEEMLQKLSDLFRYTLRASSRDLVSLSDELYIIEEYLEIEKIRLGDRLSYSIDMENKVSDVLIPGLILQPLVENSIKHGIAPIKAGGHITIKCYQDGPSFCQIEILDTGKGFSQTKVAEGFGLSGIRERLALYYDNEFEFQISNGGGVRISMRIPLNTREPATP